MSETMLLNKSTYSGHACQAGLAGLLSSFVQIELLVTQHAKIFEMLREMEFLTVVKERRHVVSLGIRTHHNRFLR